MWTARKRDTDPGGCPQFSFTKEQRRVSVFYVYIFDEQMGPGFIKICTYFPYPVKVWVNGHEWAKRQAPPPGSASPRCPTGSPPATTRPPCSRSATASAPAPCRCGSSGGWPGSRCRSPPPTGTPGTGGSCRCGRSRPPAPWSSTTTVHARAFFEALLCENMDLGRPENVELLFRRGQRLGRPDHPAAGRRVQDQDRPVLRPGHPERVLQELPAQAVPEGRRRAAHRDRRQRARRTCGCNRLLPNLPELQAKARAINARLLETETAGQGTALVSPVIERITRPTVTGEGRKAPALRFGDLRVQALAGAARRHAVHGHRHHQQEPARPDDRPAAPPLQHEPGQLRPVPAGPQRPDPHASPDATATP